MSTTPHPVLVAKMRQRSLYDRPGAIGNIDAAITAAEFYEPLLRSILSKPGDLTRVGGMCGVWWSYSPGHNHRFSDAECELLDRLFPEGRVRP